MDNFIFSNLIAPLSVCKAGVLNSREYANSFPFVWTKELFTTRISASKEVLDAIRDILIMVF